MIRHRRLLTAIVLCVVVPGVALSFRTFQRDVPDFTRYAAGAERKAVFFDYFLPLIEKRNGEILQVRRQLEFWVQNRSNLDRWQERTLQQLARSYGMESFDFGRDADWADLFKRVDAVPPSLVLAQAANESAWGTSRFARQGYNFFGQWCFERGCGMVPDERDAGAQHEVAVFDSPAASLRSYIRNLNSHKAYNALREIRSELRASNEPLTGGALAAGLTSYSARGEEYVAELRSMIHYNDLVEYDID